VTEHVAGLVLFVGKKMVGGVTFKKKTRLRGQVVTRCLYLGRSWVCKGEGMFDFSFQVNPAKKKVFLGRSS
jgi:hypothetical protein